MPNIRKKAVPSSRPRNARGGNRRHQKCRLTVHLGDFHKRSLKAELTVRPMVLTTRSAEHLAETFAALGHKIRLRILGKLLQGPASYEELVRLTGVRSGPLYFHLEQLRSAQLIGPKRRDRYALTRRGEAFAMVASVFPKLRV